MLPFMKRKQNNTNAKKMDFKETWNNIKQDNTHNKFHNTKVRDDNLSPRWVLCKMQ